MPVLRDLDSTFLYLNTEFVELFLRFMPFSYRIETGASLWSVQLTKKAILGSPVLAF